MRLIIAGTREWANYPALTRVLDVALERTGWHPTTVVSGMALGVDLGGVWWACERGLPYDPHPADWTTHGRAAGPIRNREMALVADAAILLAYEHSRGSLDCLRACRCYGLPVVWCDAATGRMRLHPHTGDTP